jgi:hypothetical protein
VPLGGRKGAGLSSRPIRLDDADIQTAKPDEASDAVRSLDISLLP